MSSVLACAAVATGVAVSLEIGCAVAGRGGATGGAAALMAARSCLRRMSCAEAREAGVCVCVCVQTTVRHAGGRARTLVRCRSVTS